MTWITMMLRIYDFQKWIEKSTPEGLIVGFDVDISSSSQKATLHIYYTGEMIPIVLADMYKNAPDWLDLNPSHYSE